MPHFERIGPSERTRVLILRGRLVVNVPTGGSGWGRSDGGLDSQGELRAGLAALVAERRFAASARISFAPPA